ncbi:MAG: glycosyltransferase [Pseudarcicella sp.]|nr:glycosyltransferase [Pseudarcicella sp.]MBP6410723.1 glycosyltransferase [Pseudarcicella sp.]
MSSHNESNIHLSIVIPVFNRPIEIDELLNSLCKQTKTDFEVIIIEDGSSIKCNNEVEKYKSLLNIQYHFKPNSGPGLSRNYGNDKANGNYTIFLDSDCIIPPHYIQSVYENLNKCHVDAFGGPDKADENFSVLQKAINYAMTSFFTTGGIRGGSEKLDKFYPRSFNMGYSKAVFSKTGGFSNMRFGEDIDMSIRILNNGFKTALIKDAYVYHKRRTNFRQFFKQVFNSGSARINLFKRHPGSLKIVHTFPSLFLLGFVLLLIGSVFISSNCMIPLGLYATLVFIDSSLKNSNIIVGFMAIFASFCQLIGYGSGFLIAVWKRILFSNGEYAAFKENFYD